MQKRNIFYSLILSLLFNLASGNALSCESCTIPRIGRLEEIKKVDSNRPWFFDFTFEQQNWEARSAHDAHLLHDDGHHVHNKTHEEFYHFTLGTNPVKPFSLFAEIPWVVRHSTEVHSHSRLGEKEQSEGIGDLHLIGTYRFLQRDNGYFGIAGGIKFPTGETKEKNSQGSRFEPELQPGSGSYDYPMGVIYQYPLSLLTFRGNAIYVVRTEGAQDFEFGDLLSASLVIDFPISLGLQSRAGLEINLQHEEKQTDHGVRVEDSGGTTLLMGPALTLHANDHLSFSGNFLMPVYQNLGGVHQELDFIWNAGGKIMW